MAVTFVCEISNVYLCFNVEKQIFLMNDVIIRTKADYGCHITDVTYFHNLTK